MNMTTTLVKVVSLAFHLLSSFYFPRVLTPNKTRLMIPCFIYNENKHGLSVEPKC